MHYKKQEEKKKQRRAEMAAKYPMTHPRENVSVVLTGSKRDYSSLINASAANRIAGNLKNVVQNTWENMGAAAVNYSAASKASADQIGRVAAGQATNTWRNMGSAASNYSSALTESADHTARFYRDTARVGGALESSRADANLQTSNAAANYLKQNGQKAWSHHGDNMSEYGTAMANHALRKPADYVEVSMRGNQQWKDDRYNAQALQKDPGYQRYMEFVKKNNFAGTVEGVASIPYILGKDHAAFEPQPYWTDAERNEFGYQYSLSAQEAVAYAKKVNDSYKKKNEEKVSQWAAEHPVFATGGAWIADRIGVAETQYNELNYAREGELPYSTQVLPTRFSELVRESIREAQNNEGGIVIGDIYASLDSALNEGYYGGLQKNGGNVLSLIVAGVENYSRDYNKAIYDAKARGALDEEAIEYARRMGGSSLVGGWASDLLSEHIPGTKGVSDSIMRESFSNAAGELLKGVADNEIERKFLGENSQYNTLVKGYTSAGYSQEQAESMAWQMLGAKLTDKLKDTLMTGTVYGLGNSDNSVKRSLFK